MAGLNAYGIALQRSDMAGTPTFAPIANVTNVSGPEIERDTIDVTAHDSPNLYREFVGGLIDAGEVSVEVNYDPREHDTLGSDLQDTTARDYKLVFPGTLGEWAFKAFMTGFSPEGPVEDKLAAELTFKVTGKPTMTTGS